MKRKLIASLLVTLVVVGGTLAYLLTGARPQLGLDLRGGISAVLTPVLEPGEELDDEVLDETIAVIRQRVDSLGVAEPEISRQGDDVLIQLPGLQDEDRAREVIGRTAKLTFRLVEAILQPGTAEYEAAAACAVEAADLADSESGVLCGPVEEGVLARDENGLPVTDEQGLPVVEPLKYQLGEAVLTGADVATALPVFGQGGWGTELELAGDAAQTFAQITGELACQRDAGQLDNFAIVLDGVVESAPGMNPSIQCNVGITGGTAFIASGGTDQEIQQQEASDLAIVLKTGALPITLEPSTFERVSPTLGAESLRSGLIAGAVGLVIVAVYLIGFYRWLGVIAIGALLVFGVLIVGLITALGNVGFTLTLAGIAGVIVSIGIAADSSIIYFERLRDEVSSGRTMRTSVQRAFGHAFRTNLTGNTVTIAAAIILYFLAVGPVRGFALTLGVSTALDLVILYVYTRAAVQLLGQGKRLTARSVRASVATDGGAK